MILDHLAAAEESCLERAQYSTCSHEAKHSTTDLITARVANSSRNAQPYPKRSVKESWSSPPEPTQLAEAIKLQSTEQPINIYGSDECSRKPVLNFAK